MTDPRVAIYPATWQAFADEHVERIPGESNAKEAERVLREFGAAFDQPDPKRVTYTMVERFVSILRDKGNVTTTRNKKLKYLRAAFNKAVKRDYIARNPMTGWHWTREEEREPTPRFTSRLDGRYEQGHKNSDDGNHHQQLD